MGFSECDPQISNISITWDLVRNANSWAHLRPTALETLEVGPVICFQVPQMILMELKFEHQWSGVKCGYLDFKKFLGDSKVQSRLNTNGLTLIKGPYVSALAYRDCW